MWYHFEIFALVTLALWTIGMIFAFVSFFVSKKWIDLVKLLVVSFGIAALLLFIVILWIKLDRPPMRTLGETRLWYSFFIAIIGLLVYRKWKYNWLLAYCLMLAVVFLLLNYLKPEIHNKALMPALQSFWFVPHVIVYMISYAILAVSSLIGFKGIYELWRKRFSEDTLKLGDNLVYIGFGFLTMGLVFGALWAKEAWGYYWTWDPKETWAFLTWIVYLFYIHYRYNKPKQYKTHTIILALAFIILLICWFGINYLPSAQNSVHVYSN